MTWLLLLWRSKGLITAGLALCVIGGLFLWVKALQADVAGRDRDLATAAADRQLLEDALAANKTAMERLRQEAAMQLAAVEADREAAERRAQALGRIKEDVYRAAKEDDGPVARVLAGALDGLRSAGAPGPHGPGGAGEGPGQPAALPAGAAGSRVRKPELRRDLRDRPLGGWGGLPWETRYRSRSGRPGGGEASVRHFLKRKRLVTASARKARLEDVPQEMVEKECDDEPEERPRAA